MSSEELIPEEEAINFITTGLARFESNTPNYLKPKEQEVRMPRPHYKHSTPLRTTTLQIFEKISKNFEVYASAAVTFANAGLDSNRHDGGTRFEEGYIFDGAIQIYGTPNPEDFNFGKLYRSGRIWLMDLNISDLSGLIIGEENTNLTDARVEKILAGYELLDRNARLASLKNLTARSRRGMDC